MDGGGWRCGENDDGGGRESRWYGKGDGLGKRMEGGGMDKWMGGE